MSSLLDFKDFGNGWSVGLDDGAGIVLRAPGVCVRFYPFPIKEVLEVEDEYRFTHIDGVIYRGFSLSRKDANEPWFLDLQVPEIDILISDAPLEIKDHLEMLCEKYEDNHGVPPWIKSRRGMI